MKIIINNSYCTALGVTPNLRKALMEELSYKNPATEYAYHKNLRQVNRLRKILNSKAAVASVKAMAVSQIKKLMFLHNKLKKETIVELYENDEFPTGLMPRVMDFLEKENVAYEIEDRRIVPKELPKKFIFKTPIKPLRYYQQEAVKLAKEVHRGVICLPTGAGKTIAAVKIIWELNVRTLIVTPGKEICDMMVDTMTEYFGKSKVEKLNTKSGKLKDINICNVQALAKLDPAIIKDVGLVIIDEFHRSASETYQQVNKHHLKNVYYRIGLTGTYYRNDGADLAMEGVLSEVLYELEIRKAISENFLVKPDFIWINNSNILNVRTYQQEYSTGVVLNKDRNCKIAEIVVMHPNDSVIVLVQQIEHGEALKSLIPSATFINGSEKNDIRKKMLEDFRSGKIKCLIGTSVIGEGVDLPIANVLIMAGGGKAKSQIIQNVGRVLRVYPGKRSAVVYDFKDVGSKYLSDHASQREVIYKTY